MFVMQKYGTVLGHCYFRLELKIIPVRTIPAESVRLKNSGSKRSIGAQNTPSNPAKTEARPNLGGSIPGFFKAKRNGMMDPPPRNPMLK